MNDEAPRKQGTHRAGEANTHGTKTDRVAATMADAAEFGIHVRQGGWRLGLLVARNAFTGKATDKINATQVALGKVSTTDYAKIAGVERRTVQRYLDAWARAATAGWVPHAADMVPGQHIDLHPKRMPAWRDFWRREPERTLLTPPLGRNFRPSRPRTASVMDAANTSGSLIVALELALRDPDFGAKYQAVHSTEGATLRSNVDTLVMVVAEFQRLLEKLDGEGSA